MVFCQIHCTPHGDSVTNFDKYTGENSDPQSAKLNCYYDINVIYFAWLTLNLSSSSFSTHQLARCFLSPLRRLPGIIALTLTSFNGLWYLDYLLRDVLPIFPLTIFLSYPLKLKVRDYFWSLDNKALMECPGVRKLRSAWLWLQILPENIYQSPISTIWLLCDQFSTHTSL